MAARWLGAAALAFIAEQRIGALAGLAEEVATHSADPMLRETAQWIAERRLAGAMVDAISSLAVLPAERAPMRAGSGAPRNAVE